MDNFHNHHYSKRPSNEVINPENKSNSSPEHDFDTLLIKKVQNYPCLYITKKEPKELIPNTWKNIAAELNVSVEDCESRWRRLRQYYSKERQKQEAESRPLARQWPLYRLMSFLEPHISRKKSFTKKKRTGNSLTNAKMNIDDQELISNVAIHKNDSMDMDQSDKQITCEIETEFSSLDQDNSEYPDENSDNATNTGFNHENSSLMDTTATTEGLGKSINNEMDRSFNTSISKPLVDVTNNAIKTPKNLKKDEENAAIADLVEKRLKNISNISKKNSLILKILNIIFE